MWLLLNLKDDVTSLYAWGLVTLAAEFDLGTTSDALIDVNVENLAVDDGLLAIALLAAILVLDDLALSVTVRAYGLEALDHRSHLAHHGLHAVTVATRALLDGTLLAADTAALRADYGPLQSEFGNFAAVDILQGDLVCMMDRTSLGRAAVVHASEHATHTAHATEAAAAEELSKQVLGSHTTAGTATLEASLAILIVDLALIGVGKDFVGMGNFLKLVLGSGVVRILVW